MNAFKYVGSGDSSAAVFVSAIEADDHPHSHPTARNRKWQPE
jgi:hypothetical protein